MPGTSDPVGYEPERYWSERLGAHFDLHGTGHLAYSVRYNRWLYRAKHRALRRALAPVPRGACALDVGSGTGWVVERLLEHGATVTGCDIVEPAVTRLRGAFPDVTFLRVDIGRQPVPYADASFDLVTICDVTYHVTDDDAWSGAMVEAARLLRGGGQLIVIDGFGATERRPDAHVRFRTLARWREVTDEAGLRLDTLIPCYRWLSRKHEAVGFRYVPDRVRGPLEYALELVLPRAPHMRVARFTKL